MKFFNDLDVEEGITHLCNIGCQERLAGASAASNLPEPDQPDVSCHNTVSRGKNIFTAFSLAYSLWKRRRKYVF